MHINSHFAIGVIFASICHYFFYFTFLEFSLIIISAFICDFDVFFSKIARDHNHRNLISHSIIPSLVIICVGIILNWIALIVSGIVYFIHIVVDLFDWGTNFFYFNRKTYGPRFLMSKEEDDNLSQCLAKYKRSASFFDFKYYKSKIALTLEILLFLLMLYFIIIFACEYLWIIIFYFLGLYFHLSRHFHLKKVENA